MDNSESPSQGASFFSPIYDVSELMTLRRIYLFTNELFIVTSKKQSGDTHVPRYIKYNHLHDIKSVGMCNDSCVFINLIFVLY